MSDPFDLERFVSAQEASRNYEQALAELRAGRKQSHWMWFVLPQVAGLGRSATAQRYAVSGLPEARAFLAHPVLGPRLLECARVLTSLDERDPRRVLGDTDAMKLRSSMTLFERAAAGDAQGQLAAELFASVLDHYFGGQRDDATIALVDGAS
jgi:uncharacterized protein (DUF1810 family)